MLASLIHFLIFPIYNSAGSHYPVSFRSQLFKFKATDDAVSRSSVILLFEKISCGLLDINLAFYFRWIVSFFKNTYTYMVLSVALARLVEWFTHFC